MAVTKSLTRTPRAAVAWILLAALVSSAALAESKMVLVGYGILSPWRYQISGWKPCQKVKPGDQLVFRWFGPHDVWRFSTKIAYDSCDFTLATKLHPATNVFGGRYVYTVKGLQKGQTLYFGCAVGNHCARNMKAKVPIS